MRTQTSLLLVALALTSSCGSPQVAPQAKPRVQVSSFRIQLEDACLIETLLAPERIEAYRIQALLQWPEIQWLDDPKYADRFLAGAYLILGKADDPSLDFGRRLTAYLLEDANFDRDHSRGVKACAFAPGVAIRYSRQTQEVMLLVCFECGDIGIRWRRGEVPIERRDFLPTYATMVAFSREAFPNDSEIQSLHDRPGSD